MVFNSYEFLVFFCVAYLGYLLLQQHLRLQNIWLLAMSYLFYATWNWKFLGLLLLSSTIDFFVAINLENTTDPQKRRRFFALSLIVNIGTLGIFKYFNFFADSFSDFSHLFGFRVNIFTLHVILPLGISFYTIQELGYVIDVYRGRMKACRNFVNFALFVAYFPHLVAGPVQRSTHLLPAIEKKRTLSWTQIQEGVLLIVLGLFYKTVIADNLALIADRAFDQTGALRAESVLLGVYAFAFQIYGDFMGYSTIARGLSKLFGIELMLNFNVPYFSCSIDEFWKRWHISLSNWLRDYLYIELGGNRGGKRARNLFLTMLIGGFWHGAKWTMIIWGSMHGIYLVLWKWVRDRIHWHVQNPVFRGVLVVAQTFLVFQLVCLAWIFFRANSLFGVQAILMKLASRDYSVARFQLPERLAFGLIAAMVVIDAIHYARDNEMIVTGLAYPYRVLSYLCFGLFILFAGGFNFAQFIYFQF